MSEEKQPFDKKAYDHEYNKAKRGHILFEYAIEKDYKARIRTLAARQKLSVNGWIAQAIEEKLARESDPASDHWRKLFCKRYATACCSKLRTPMKPNAGCEH